MSVLGIDLGTQSLKALIYSPSERRLLAAASAPLSLTARDDGTREQHPDQWVAALESAMAALPAEARSTVAALSVSAQQHGFVALSASGEVLCPAKLWCDTTTVAECDDIVAEVGRTECMATVGPITTGFTAPKVLWLKRNRPDLFAKLRTIMLPHDFLNFHLTGRRVAECGDASGTALLDVRARAWSARMLRAVDESLSVAENLPRLIDAHEPVGRLQPHVAEKLGLPADVLVAAGGGDNMMAAIGTGNVVPGRLTASLGTSGTLFAHARDAVIDRSGALAAFCSSTGGHLPLLCTMNCTVATAQLRSLLDVDLGDMDALVARVAPGCDGVVTLPFFNGERVPDLPHGKAAVVGLDVRNCTKGHVLRSAMEAAVFGLRRGVDAFRAHGLRFESVTVTGGGSASAAWRQMVADVFGVRVLVLNGTDDAAAMGAALQALWCLGRATGTGQGIEEITRTHVQTDEDRTCLPDADNVERYERAYAKYLRVLAAMTPLFTE